MKIIECTQGSPEWITARLGKASASRMGDLTAKIKTGYGASRANYMAELLVERLTGQPAEKYTNAAMAWGTEQEPAARQLYELMTDVEVKQVGLVLHPSIEDSIASPDGLVGDVGLIEIKCPNSATHIETLLGSEIDGKHLKQMQWQMACTGRAWCDFVSFDPRLPGEMQMSVARVMRDDAMIRELEAETVKFLAELASKQSALVAKYRAEAA